jgi:FkbM family methyltransferase
MRPVARVAGGLSRRLGRPELLALVDPGARQAQREEIGISAVIASCLRSTGTYVDIGANRGQVLRDAVRVAPHARHVAFEPIPGLAEQIARDFPSVECRVKAVGARAETTEFCHFRRLDGWSGLRRRPEISDEAGEPEYITVEVSTLDQEMQGLTPSVLKIDVEGAELDVLTGGRELISAARPVIIFEHVYEASALYGAQRGAPWDLLTELGYQIFCVTGKGPFTRQAFTDPGPIVNWLAAPGT